jgi:hypothetical protein
MKSGKESPPAAPNRQPAPPKGYPVRPLRLSDGRKELQSHLPQLRQPLRLLGFEYLF